MFQTKTFNIVDHCDPLHNPSQLVGCNEKLVINGMITVEETYNAVICDAE